MHANPLLFFNNHLSLCRKTQICISRAWNSLKYMQHNLLSDGGPCPQQSDLPALLTGFDRVSAHSYSVLCIPCVFWPDIQLLQCFPVRSVIWLGEKTGSFYPTWGVVSFVTHAELSSATAVVLKVGGWGTDNKGRGGILHPSRTKVVGGLIIISY